MDYSLNPSDAPPGYAESPSTVPYGQSRLLHGYENTGPPSKSPSHQPGFDGASSGPYPPSGAPPGYFPYGAPPYGHPMGPAYPPPGYSSPQPPAPQQQQQSVVVISEQRRHHPILIGHVQSYAGHIVLACFVTWCCCFIFGLIAFILAGTLRPTLCFDTVGWVTWPVKPVPDMT